MLACNLTHLTLEELTRKFTLIKRYCKEVGRDEDSIHRTVYVNCFPGETVAEALAKIANTPGKLPFEHISDRGLFSTPKVIQQRLIELEQHGVQEVIFSRRSILLDGALSLIAQCIN